MGYYFDRVRETTTTTGTGTVTLGGAVFGCRTFASVLSNNQLVPYVVDDPTTGAWECGWGTYSSSTLVRTTITASSNSGAAVNFASGIKYVFLDATAASLIQTHEKNTHVPGSAAGGRLTLYSGNPVADVSSASTLYYTPYVSNQIGLYDTTAGKLVYVGFSETSIAISGLTAGRNYDVFGYLNGNVFELELLAWTNDTTRATAIAMDGVLGIYTKSGATTRRYLGTVRTVTSTTMTDYHDKRFVWNMHNQTPRRMYKYEAPGGWPYSASNTWRNFNNSAANRVEWVDGMGATTLDLTAQSRMYAAAAANNFGRLGIGVDVSGSTQPTQGVIAYMQNAAYDLCPVVQYVGVPGVGYHFAQVQEYCFSNSVSVYFHGIGDGLGGVQGTLTI